MLNSNLKPVAVAAIALPAPKETLLLTEVASRELTATDLGVVRKAHRLPLPKRIAPVICLPHTNYKSSL